MVDEQPLVEKATETKKPKNIKNSIIIFVSIFLLFILIIEAKPIYNGVNDYFNPSVPSPPALVVHNLTAADVNLYKFLDISNNKTSSAEIWILNLGEKPAKNISVFVRARSDNGTILFQGNISLTSELLRENETCSGVYSFKTGKTVHKIFETIEVSYDSGRHSYQKETSI